MIRSGESSVNDYNSTAAFDGIFALLMMYGDMTVYYMPVLPQYAKLIKYLSSRFFVVNQCISPIRSEQPWLRCGSRIFRCAEFWYITNLCFQPDSSDLYKPKLRCEEVWPLQENFQAVYAVRLFNLRHCKRDFYIGQHYVYWLFVKIHLFIQMIVMYNYDSYNKSEVGYA